MKMKILLSLALFAAVVVYSGYSFADVAEEATQETSLTTEEQAKDEAPATATTETPAASESVVEETVEVVEEGAPAAQAIPSVPNPYTNVSDPEFYLLQQLTAELAATAQRGVAQAEAGTHGGRYGEDNYIGMHKSFAEASGTLSATLNTAPVDIRKVHVTIKALKTLVMDIDDVFVYNPGYLGQIRNWNECKRILRRIDGTVYREGGLRRTERILDQNEYIRGLGKFLKISGLLGRVDDHLHRTNPTGPMDQLVGRHGGGRRAAHVWMLPSATYDGKMANDRSAFNEAVQQY